jgi:hypothetical protein
LFVPTGVYPFPGGGERAWQAMHGHATIPLCQLGWKSLGVLELTALPTIREENWVPAVREADALLVWGGDVLSGIPVPTYAIDDNTAIKVVDGTVDVISEGDWRLINP